MASDLYLMGHQNASPDIFSTTFVSLWNSKDNKDLNNLLQIYFLVSFLLFKQTAYSIFQPLGTYRSVSNLLLKALQGFVWDDPQSLVKLLYKM